MKDDGQGLYHRAYEIEEHEVKDFYAEWASTYDSELVDGKGYALPDRCAAAFVHHVQEKAAPIIDLGCGTGLLGSRLATAGFTTIDGVDYSPEMLDVSQATGAYRDLVTADLNQPFEFGNRAYAGVAAMGVFSFHHVHADSLDKMRRILTTGGHLIIGINEPFYDEGSVPAKLEQMETDGLLTIELREYGAHMPASQVNGWVIVARRQG